MAHHKATPKATPKANTITVRDANNTYTARWDGEKASSTAGHEQAARTLAARMLGIEYQAVRLEQLPAEQPHQWRYRVSE